jgi:hypothetical protein
MQVDSMKSELWPPLFAFTKEFLKNTEENMPPDHFCAHLRQDGQIDLPSSPDCHIFIAISKHLYFPHLTPKKPYGYMAIWPLWRQIAIYLYGRYGIKDGHYGFFRKQP